MAHAIHFLERLERGSLVHIERALKLYNSPRQMRVFLSMLNPSEEHERLALSLDGEDKGPFAVITREGAFVTCLGEGMSLRGLYLVNHERLQVLWQQAEANLEQFDEAVSWVSGRGGTWEDLIELLYRKHSFLSREEFLMASSLRDVLFPWLNFLHKDLFCKVEDLGDLLRPVSHRPFKKHRESFYSHWKGVWAMSHLEMLLTMRGARGMEELLQRFDLSPEEIEEKRKNTFFGGSINSFFWLAFRQGELPICMRCVWGMGRLGKPLIARFKEVVLSSTSTYMAWSMAMLGLLLISLRHSKYQPEIYKVITSKSFIEAFAKIVVLKGGSPEIFQHILGLLSIPDRMYENSLELARQECFEQFQKLDLAPPYHYKSPEDIPEDVAMVVFVNTPGDMMNKPDVLILLLAAMPWLARVEAEALYFPQELLEQLPRQWDYEHAQSVVHRRKEYYPTPKPVQHENKVGRNDPCPCGSGKKYKKCCREVHV